MKNSYKLALIAAIVLCVSAVAYYFFPRAAPPARIATTALTAARAPATAGAGRTEPGTRAAAPAQAVDRRAALKLTTTGPDLPPPTVAPGPDASPPDRPPMRVIPPPAGRPAQTPSQRPVTRPATTQRVATSQPARPRPSTYTIKPGDTFAAIAKAVYGSEQYLVHIAQANPLVDPLKLQPGQVIRMPRVVAAVTPGRGTVAGPPEGSVYYVIRADDTLSRIARNHYADPRLWRLIYRANRVRIGPDPDRIQPGTRIVIPPRPTAVPGVR